MTVVRGSDNRIFIDSIEDVVKARQLGSLMAQQMGFSSSQSMIVATSISELARNIVLYANKGEIVIDQKQKGSRAGIIISAVDNGPGIENLEEVLNIDGSLTHGTGFGLSGVKQMADDFAITTGPEKGTEVTVTVWPE